MLEDSYSRAPPSSTVYYYGPGVPLTARARPVPATPYMALVTRTRALACWVLLGRLLSRWPPGLCGSGARTEAPQAGWLGTEQQVIQRLLLRPPPHGHRDEVHAAVVGKAVTEAGHDGLDGPVGHAAGEVPTPPAATYRLVQSAHRVLEAMFGTSVAADPSHRLQAEVQQHLGGRPAGPTLLAQQGNQALVGDPEAAGIKKQEERTAGRRCDDVVENIEDVAVMRRCGNALAGILVDNRDEFGATRPRVRPKKARPVPFVLGPTPEDALCRAVTVLVAATAGEAVEETTRLAVALEAVMPATRNVLVRSRA